MKMATMQLKLVAVIVACLGIATLCHVLYKYSKLLTASPRPLQQVERVETKLTYNDVIVRSVYFDDRPRNGHDRIVVFLVAARVALIESKSVIACGVGKNASTNLIVRSLEENRLMHTWLYVNLKLPHFPFEEYIVECYNIPEPMINGSSAFILYKNTSDSLVHMATSEIPLMFPSPRVLPTGKYDFSVVTCTEAHNKKVAWLREFIRYQKTIGVDRVHVNILDTFINDGGLDTLLQDPQVAKGVAEGYVTMTVWKDILEASNKIYSYSAILRKLDCIYRFRGTYDYAFLLDSDDFFNPLVHGKSHIQDYIQNWCRGDKSAGSCYFNWYYFYPEACGMKAETADDGNITRLLKSYKSWNNNHFKSVHLISAILDTGYHHAQCNGCLLPGYHAVHIDPRIAYMAHLRKYANPPDGC